MMQCKNIGVTSGLLPPHNPMSKPITTLSTFIQVMLAFLIAGFGNVGAGLILDYVKEWPVFLHVDELFILVPSLLGLKGNLEMTMASRLSTQANLGHMDNTHKLLEMAKGNLALVQCQATVVSLSVAIFASTIKSMTFQTGSNGLGSDSMIEQSSSMMGNLLDATSSSGVGGGGPTAMMFKNNTFNATGTGAVVGAGSLVNDSSLLQAFDTTNTANGGGGPLVERQMNGFDWDNALILCASSLLTANIACFVLGTMMILVIVGSHKVRIDPDNIASPVAASLGDMTTAALLAVIAHSIYQYSENQRLPYLALIITLLFVGMLPVWISVAKNNPYTSDVITKGWTPIVIAVFISSCGGFILEHGKSRFSRLPVFQPVINGVGGNLVAVQASRLSTSLHRNGKPGELPSNFQLFSSPMELFLSKKNDINMTTARLLLLMSIPAHLLYFFVIRSIEGDSTAPVTAVFLGFYMAFAVLQVAVLLYLAQNLVNALWTCSIDPDNYSIPILTATGDLLGCAFLLIVFVIAFQFNDPYVMTTV
uniref:Solute carrier family 41 member 1 n=1 Tax=Aceria tosichella TaxID=561515 RepID=A0A6G1SGW1_9ACAR